MRHWRRRAGRLALGGFAIVLGVVTLVVVVLAFPDPLFAHKQSFDEITLYSSDPLSPHIQDVVDSVRDRVRAMEYGRPDAKVRVYICGTPRLYSLFARLTRRAPNSLAICVSALRTMYLNETKIRRFAATNYHGIRHCRYEGSVAEVIAHEIAHFNIVRRVGYRRSLRIPMWKSEGYAEYQANIAATRADPHYDFGERVELLLDDGVWRNSPVARDFYESHVLVEYLATQQGISLDGLLEADVTRDAARGDMLAWYRAR